MHQESTGTSINVGPRVGDLTSGLKNVGDHTVASLDKVDEVVILDVGLSEVELAHEARVGLSEDGVAVSGDNLPAGEDILNVATDIVFGPLGSELLLEVEEELEALLVSETVERASKTVHTS